MSFRMRAHGGKWNGKEAEFEASEVFSFPKDGAWPLTDENVYIWDGTYDEDGARHYVPATKEER